MKNLIKYGILLIIAACSSIKDSNLPEWYLNPPKDNSAYLYGVGSGITKEQASKIALNNIAEKLSVTISSEFESDKQEARVGENSIYESNSSQNVKAKVSQIEFTNYEIAKSIKSSGSIYALVQVSRQGAIANYQEKVINLDKKIDNIFINFSKLSSLEKFAKLQTAKKKIAENEIYLRTAELLAKNKSFSKPYYKKYDALIANEAGIKSDLKIKIIAKPSDAKIATVVTESLNNLGIKTINNLDPKNKDQAILKIATTTTSKKIYGSNITKIIIDLKLIENFGSQIAAGKTEVRGSSAIGFVESNEAALKSLREEIANKGFFTIMGL